MHSNQLTAALGCAAALAACGGKTVQTTKATVPTSGPCAGIAGSCIPFTAGSSTEAEIDSAFSQAQDGTTLAFGPGTFSFVNTLTLINQNDIKVIGAGIDVTILDFSSQTAGADGLDAETLSGLTLYNFTVQNSKGNAIKVLKSENILFETVKAAWSTPGSVLNGPYGLYPIGVTNLLMENCQITGASDSGIYIGQSINVVARNNTAWGNVAGIEIENTYYGDVYGNLAHDNTAGILVFDLPNLPQEGGHDIHVHDNQIVNNNAPNFATNGDIVAIVPAGTGFFVMASHDVEIDGNTVTGNNTIGLAVISYYLAQVPITDPLFYPYPHDIWLHDNTVSGNGSAPDAAEQMGLLFLAEQDTFPGDHAPDLAWDGVYDPAWAADAGTLLLPDGGRNPNPARICFTGNGSAATFVDLNMCQLEIYGSDGGISCPGLNPPSSGVFEAPDGGSGYPTNLGAILSTDPAPFDCDAPTVGPVDAGLSFSASAL